MCSPEFFGVGTKPELLRENAPSIADPEGRQNRPGFIQRQPVSKGRQQAGTRGRVGDIRTLRSAGLNLKESEQLAQFAAFRGGLDAFENIAAARRAFAESGAFTERALAPKPAEQVSRFAGGTVNVTRVGAAELRGLPLIRRG